MFNKEVKLVFDPIKAFPERSSLNDHLKAIRWNSDVLSPFDGTSKVWKCNGKK